MGNHVNFSTSLLVLYANVPLVCLHCGSSILCDVIFSDKYSQNAV